MKKELREVYVADDGTVFGSPEDCEAYERELRLREMYTTYWRVIHSPDLTEGRGYYGLTLIECYIPDPGCVPPELWVRDWCFQKFGRPIAFVQGIAPMPSWELRKIGKEEFNQPNQFIRVGDYKYPAKRIRLVLDRKKKGLVEEPTELGAYTKSRLAGATR